MIEENSTPESGNTATLESTPDTTEGTVPAGSDVAETASTDQDTFTKVDPKTLPPALKQYYDNMLKDYKEKTTSISERVKQETAKAAAAYQEKATLYDQIAANDKFVQKWNEFVQEQQSQGQQGQGNPELSELKAKFEEINHKIQMSEMSQITDAFAEAKNEKGVPLHPDFDELNSLQISQGPNGEELSLLNICVKLAPGDNPQERLANGYKQAKMAYNSIFEAGRKAGMGRVQAKVQNGTLPPSNSSGEMISITDKKPRNAREALDMAKKGLMVSRD